MNRDDVMRETLQHVRLVGDLMLVVVRELQCRAMRHDDSKFSPAEFDAFAEETPKLRGLTYNSPEYHDSIKRLGPALMHHYAFNDHHPEHHQEGIHGMDLLQLIEMLADWKAATARHADGNVRTSITQNASRFGYDNSMVQLLTRTAENLGWLPRLNESEAT